MHQEMGDSDRCPRTTSVKPLASFKNLTACTPMWNPSSPYDWLELGPPAWVFCNTILPTLGVNVCYIVDVECPSRGLILRVQILRGVTFK